MKQPTELTIAEAESAAMRVASAAVLTELATLPEADCCGKCIAFLATSSTKRDSVGFCRLNPPTVLRSGQVLASCELPPVHAKTGVVLPV
jgi:hypothetical protein